MATFEAIKDNEGQWHRTGVGCGFLEEVMMNDEYEEKTETNLSELDERDGRLCPECFPQEAQK